MTVAKAAADAPAVTVEPTAPAAPIPEPARVSGDVRAALAAAVAELPQNRVRLEAVKSELARALEVWQAALNAAHEAYAAACGPLARERDGLLKAIDAGEKAEAELARRRERAAELRAQLAELEATLPPTE